MKRIKLTKLHFERQKAKIAMTRSVVALISIAFGVLIMAQWRSVPDRVTNPVAPYVGLKETKDSLIDEQSQLKDEIKSLQTSIENAQEMQQDVSLTRDEISNLNSKKAKAGLTRLNGPGVIVVLDDSKTNTTSEDNIVHAADLRDIINLLWGSGAEAISVNGQRMVINTAVDCIVNTIMVNDIRISNPFRIEAIGDQNKMYFNLRNSEVVVDLQNRRKTGLTFEVSKNNDITVPVFDGSFETKGKVVN